MRALQTKRIFIKKTSFSLDAALISSMLLQQFIKVVVEKRLFSPGDRLVVAVSGGVDSVVLCDLCHKAGFTFEIAHVNFQLRGQESMLDECFVKGLANHYHVPIHLNKFDTAAYAANNKVSVQVAARDLRYSWFSELLEIDGGWLLTAHHADDNVETVLMNFFRGTGISGLRGMQMKHDKIVRPLLDFTKKDIIEYAKQSKLNWREDSSNASEKYSRNYFRNAVLPLIYKIYPEAEQNLLKNIAKFADAQLLYNQAVEQHKKHLLEAKDNEVHIPILKLKKTVPLSTVVFEIISAFGFSPQQVNEVIHLLDGDQGAYVQSETHRIIKNRKWLIISAIAEQDVQTFVIANTPTHVSFSKRKLMVDVLDTANELSKDPDVAQLDGRHVTFPLLLRKWKAGDYFYPLGMKKKKKVSRFLIDNKLSPTQKENVWVVESNKRICWVVGMRIDERFKILPTTKQVVSMTVS